jgi:hypothetical protein
VYRNQTIRNLVSGLLLCLFTFSVTPKQWLHNIFADHKDFYSNATGDHLQFTKSGFRCDCDNLVVNTPFIQVDGPGELTIGQFFQNYQGTTICNCNTGHHFLFHLRGPPAA